MRRPAASFQEQFSDGALTLVGGSRRTGLPYHALHHAVKQGHLPAEKRGHRVAIHPEALAQYVKKGRP